MFVIVGLGNPGAHYTGTRHNVGRDVLRAVAQENGLGEPVQSSKYAGLISEGVLANTEVIFLFPETYMNKSGASVGKLVTKENVSQLVVAYDDVDLPLGEVKISFGRGSGGHNGIESITQTLGTRDFARVRIGIAGKHIFTGKIRRPRSGAPMTRHVLGAFKPWERKKLEAITGKVDDMIKTIISDGAEKAMNRFN